MGVGPDDDRGQTGTAAESTLLRGARRLPATYALAGLMALVVAAVAALIDVIAREFLDPLTVHQVGPVRVTHIEHLTTTMNIGHDAVVSAAVVVFAAWLVGVHAVFGREWRGTRLGVIPGSALIVGGIAAHALLEILSGGVPDWLIIGAVNGGRADAFDAADLAILAGCGLAALGALAAGIEAVASRLRGSAAARDA